MQRIEVILLSRNTSDTGLRIRNSIEAHGLDISRAAFCGGESPHRYVRDFGVHLFLSSSFEDVKLAIESNVAAATIIPRDGDNSRKLNQGQLKIAFDGDAVIFSDDSEKVFHEDGLDAFIKNEVSATSPLKAGPFKSFLVELNKIQNDFDVNECPIRTALVTARSAPSDKRVIKTLREWGVRIDESLFLGGMSKQQFLKSFQADIFFDDQKKHIMDAVKTTASGHVPYGVKNK
jgi:5'-nucleotidase